MFVSSSLLAGVSAQLTSYGYAGADMGKPAIPRLVFQPRPPGRAQTGDAHPAPVPLWPYA